MRVVDRRGWRRVLAVVRAGWTMTPANPNQSATAARTGGVASRATRTGDDGDGGPPAPPRRRGRPDTRTTGGAGRAAWAGRDPLLDRVSNPADGLGTADARASGSSSSGEGVVVGHRCVSLHLGSRRVRRPGRPAAAQGPVEPRLHGAARPAEHGRCLGLVEVEQVAARHHLALGAGEPGEPAHERRLALGGEQRRRPGRRPGQQQRLASAATPAARGGAPPGSAVQVAGLVGHDPQQPRAERRARTHAAERGVRLHERFLHDVLRVCARPSRAAVRTAIGA